MEDGTLFMSQLISYVMQTQQQQNLNAKHVSSYTTVVTSTNHESTASTITNIEDTASATTTTTNKDEISKIFEINNYGGHISENTYVGLHRSCSQRKYVEILLVTSDYGQLNFIRHNCLGWRSVAKRNEDRYVYLTVDHKELDSFCCGYVTAVTRTTKPFRFLFVSLKNKLAFDKNLYIVNFFYYHTFHECSQTLRNNNSRTKPMATFIYIFAKLNYKLLKNRYNNNDKQLCSSSLSLNTQSLGKSENNVVYSMFSENSIHNIKKVDVTKEFEVDSAFLNRSLNVCSPIGINSISLKSQNYKYSIEYYDYY